jgi:hypothetical protein
MILPFSLVLILLVVLAGMSWGPGHHLEYAERIWRRRREHLPRDVSTLLGEQRRAYFYGNLAADIINVKAYGGHKNHCHRWTIIDQMRARATSASEHAFIAGYLSHLAADTIAHNHFVPYHLTRYARTKGLGHLYWEMNADRWIPEKRWSIVSELKEARELDSMDELINAAVPHKALSMGTNKLIFNHLLLVSERRSWRRGMDNLHPISKVQLHKGFLELFQHAAVERVRLALHPRGFSALLHVDTNGKNAQMQAMQWRRETIARYPAGTERDSRAEKLARHFLLGMQSPPPDDGNERKPMWD